MPELWHWTAYYDDGTHLDEVDASGQSHGFKDVDLSKCIAFGLTPVRAGLPSPVVKIDLSLGMRPIFFRKRGKSYRVKDGHEENWHVCTALGWQRTVEGQNIKSLTFFFADGSVLVSDRD